MDAAPQSGAPPLVLTSRAMDSPAPLFKAPVSLVRCSDHNVCGAAEEIPGGRIIAPLLGTREAMLLWREPPKRVLLIKKWRDEDARDAAAEVGDWLAEAFGVRLCVYEDGDEDEATRFPPRFHRYQPPGCTAAASSQTSPSHRFLPHLASPTLGSGFRDAAAPQERPCPPLGSAAGDDIDLIVSVGGDGTVLHISGLFQAAMPPVVAIAFGSLGFMTVHSLNSCTDILGRILGAPLPATVNVPPLSPREPIPVSLRMRLRVDVHRRGSSPAAPPEVSHVVLNELLLERGPSPYMATLNAYVDDEPLTTVAADGLIVATQTGSTAYSLSAGGSILSPNTAAIVFTPICPHTLSFRPLLFPDSAVIRLEVPADARSSAWCSFDGRHSMELRTGDYVVVRSSPFPLPLVCRRSATGDWVRAIKCKLYWNVRERQRAFKRPGTAAPSPSLNGGGNGGGSGGGALQAPASDGHATASHPVGSPGTAAPIYSHDVGAGIGGSMALGLPSLSQTAHSARASLGVGAASSVSAHSSQQQPAHSFSRLDLSASRGDSPPPDMPASRRNSDCSPESDPLHHGTDDGTFDRRPEEGCGQPLACTTAVPVPSLGGGPRSHVSLGSACIDPSATCALTRVVAGFSAAASNPLIGSPATAPMRLESCIPPAPMQLSSGQPSPSLSSSRPELHTGSSEPSPHVSPAPLQVASSGRSWRFINPSPSPSPLPSGHAQAAQQVQSHAQGLAVSHAAAGTSPAVDPLTSPALQLPLPVDDSKTASAPVSTCSYQFLGSLSALDYPDAIEYDSDRGVMLPLPPAAHDTTVTATTRTHGRSSSDSFSSSNG